ncbi:hypothetical protein GCM10027199_67950 [Amycolatopsis magusensis]
MAEAGAAEGAVARVGVPAVAEVAGAPEVVAEAVGVAAAGKVVSARTAAR